MNCVFRVRCSVNVLGEFASVSCAEDGVLECFGMVQCSVESNMYPLDRVLLFVMIQVVSNDTWFVVTTFVLNQRGS